MWVEELSDAACPLGGFTHVCNECDSCRIGIHHSELLGKVLPYISHSLCRIVVCKDTAIGASLTVVKVPKCIKQLC